MGLDITNLGFPSFEDNNKDARVICFENFGELENYYIDHYKKQMVIMKELSEQLNIISKIEGAGSNPSNWENGEWLQAISGSNPVFWAMFYNKKINGLPAAEGARQLSEKFRVVKALYDRGFKIDNPQQILSIENRQSIRKWSKEMLPLVKDPAIKEKIEDINHLLSDYENTLKLSNLGETTLKILSILKYFITDNYFSDDIKKQVTAYEKNQVIKQAVKKEINELNVDDNNPQLRF